MDKDNKNLNQEVRPVSGIVHVLLSNSYVMFFFAVVLGVIFDIIFATHSFDGVFYEYLGIGLIVAGTLIVYWSQHITRSAGKIASGRDTNFFLHGPYRYTRNPTNFGLTLSILGLGFLIHSLFSVLFILIAYIISKVFFIRKQDAILEERYGDVFVEYRKKVKDWL
jgi:protein-S-isoprenylcysteine O-methyltransferase Ste14